MNTFLRAGLGALLGVTLLWGSALAIEYEDIYEMTAAGASDEAIIRAIVDDGRGFELSNQEIDDLRTAGVSENVIVAMQDPQAGEQWLEDNFPDPEVAPDAGGVPMTQDDYMSSLDEAYKQGYEDGRTSLVYSFGYYYGPLSLYYYNDPFYFSFWWGGYPAAYWPSYYAYSYRPYYAWCSPYPYNYYTYSSYYCHTYYDPGYWTAQGYTVQPGYGRTIYEDGPRWRDGGITPPKGGRPEDVQVAGLLRQGGTVNRNRDMSGARAIRDAGGGTVRQPGTRSGREPIASSEPVTRSAPGARRSTLKSPEAGTRGGVVRRAPESETLDRRVVRGSDDGRTRRMRDVASGSRIIRGNQVSDPDVVSRGNGTRVGRQAGLERSYSRGRESARSQERISPRATREDPVRIIRGGSRDGIARGGGRSVEGRTMGDIVRRGGGERGGDRGGQTRLAAPGRGGESRGHGGGKAAPAPQMRSGGGDSGRGGGAPVAQSRGGGGGGGDGGGHGRGVSMGRGGGGRGR